MGEHYVMHLEFVKLERSDGCAFELHTLFGFKQVGVNVKLYVE